MPLLRSLLVLFFISFATGNLFAQSVKGSWYGVGHIQMDGNSENYLSELILKQDGNSIKGEFNYYFRDSLFKNKISGSFNTKTRLLVIKQFPIIYYRSASTKKAVMVDVMGTFELRVAKTGSVINGSLTSSSERTLLMPVINYRLVKDTIAIVKNNATTNRNNQTVAIKSNVSNSTPIRNTTNKPTNTKQKTGLAALTVIQIDSLPESANHKKADTIILKSLATVDTVKPQKTVTPVELPLAKITEEAFVSRKKDYAKIIDVENAIIKLEVYDNGTIDYDSVSLLLNGKLVLPKTMLNHHSVKLTIHLDESLEFNELGMFAENLGLIPPNTAALIIHDGKKKYEFTLNSDFTKNAIIQLKTKKGNKKD